MDFTCLHQETDWGLPLAIIISTFFCLFCIVTICTAIWVFCCKSKIERPTFVTWQTIFLVICCICYVICFGIVLLRPIDPTRASGSLRYISPVLAIVGDICFALHDWIFTEQYVAASLNMPVIIKIFS